MFSDCIYIILYFALSFHKKIESNRRCVRLTNGVFYSCEQYLVLGQGWRIYMGQCVSRKAGAVVAASGNHNSPSYRIMEKHTQKPVSFTIIFINICVEIRFFALSHVKRYAKISLSLFLPLSSRLSLFLSLRLFFRHFH